MIDERTQMHCFNFTISEQKSKMDEVTKIMTPSKVSTWQKANVQRSSGWPIEGARAPSSLNHTQNNNYINYWMYICMMWYIRKSSVKNICFHHHNMTSLPVSTSQFQLRSDREIAHRRRVFVEFCQILIQDINIFKMWHKILPISVLKS